MMELLVVLAHPDRQSFNHAIAQTVCRTLRQRGHTVCFHDLYAEGFDPMLPAREINSQAELDATLEQHCEELRRAEGLVVIHPNWWGQPPAAMKGWIDRVFRPGVAYRFQEGDGGEGVPVGLLRAQTALIFNTSNTPEEREMRVFGDPLERLWRECILEFCGVRKIERKTFRVMITSTPEQRADWLKQVEMMLGKAF